MFGAGVPSAVTFCTAIREMPTDVPDGRQFMSLGACSCGRARRRVYRFCPGCGAAFADVARHESISGPLFASEPSPRAAATARTATRTENQERKQVTVLFSDICDSTELVVSMDPEEAQQVLDRALRLMSDAVNAYGGTVSQLLGDGLLALFGAPCWPCPMHVVPMFRIEISRNLLRRLDHSPSPATIFLLSESNSHP